MNMVQVNPFDMWYCAQKPELILKYQKGPHINYYSVLQLRDAFDAGRKSVQPPTTTKETWNI